MIVAERDGQMQEFTRNSNNVLIGRIGGVKRVAAFLYEVRAATTHPRKDEYGLLGTLRRLADAYVIPDEGPAPILREKRVQDVIEATCINYLVYVERLSPPLARCQCVDYLVNGDLCKHGEAAIECAKYFKDMDPEQYRDELHDRTERREQGRRTKPYRGSIRDLRE